MKNLQQVFLGIVIALISLGFILGGFSLSLAEGNITSTLAPTHTLIPTNSPTLQSLTPLADSPTPSSTLTPTRRPTLTPTLTPDLTTTWTPSLPPSPTNCPPPPGWSPYIVQSSDTLDKIALRYWISSSELQQANCLLRSGLIPGEIVYVPPMPTQTAVQCGPPYSWIVYIVRPGDTLYYLSQAYRISIGELQWANCMGSSSLLHAGQTLYVPPWARTIPSPTIPFVFTPTASLTNTPIIILPSDTPTEASTSMPTDTPVPVATDTPVEIPTETLIPTIPAEVPAETLEPPTP